MLLFGAIFISDWILWILFLVISLFGYTFYKQSIFRRIGVKGPKPVPFLGHIGRIAKHGLFDLDIQLMKEYGDVFGTFYGNFPTLVITDPEMIKEICVKQFSKFYDRAEFISTPTRWRQSLNNARGTYWKFLRFVIAPTFTPSKIKTMRPLLERSTSDFIDNLNDKMHQSKDDVIDMYPLFKCLTMDVICRAAFGIDVNAQNNPDDPFVRNASKVLGTSVNNPFLLLNFMFPDISKYLIFLKQDYVDLKAMEFLTNTIQQAIEERRVDESHPFHDLLKLMMDSKKETLSTDSDRTEESERNTFEEYKAKGLIDDEIIMNGVMFLAAGFETTSILLSWLAYCLATNPECQDKLVDEIENVIGDKKGNPSYDQIMKMEYLDMFVSETLRLYAPTVRFNREASSDVVINGINIPKGMDVTFSIHCMHRNPKYWPKPEVFDPTRFSPENKANIMPYTYLPFGVGPRNCVGMRLALVEVKLTIVKLLQHVRLEKSAKLQVPPKFSAGNLIQPENGILLKLIKV